MPDLDPQPQARPWTPGFPDGEPDSDPPAAFPNPSPGAVPDFLETLESVSDGFFVVDANLALTYLNPAAARIWGRQSEGLRGKPLLEVFPEARGQFFEEKCREVLRQRKPTAFETFFHGSPIRNWYEVRIYPCPRGLCVFSKTIPERKIMERKLRESEKRYRTLFEEALNPVLVVDEAGRYLDANRAGLDFLECDRETLLERDVWSFSPPGTGDRQRREHQPFMERRRLETEYWVNGRIKTLLLNVVPITMEGRRVLYGIGHEITRRKTAEAALREREARYRLLFEHSVMLISVYDRDGVCRLMNPRGAALFGGRPEDFQGKSFFDLHPASAEVYLHRIRAVIDTGASAKFEETVLFPTGERRLASSVHAIPDPDGICRSAQILSEDVTERRRAEAERQRLEEQFRRAQKLEIVGQLAGGVAHHLNNSLTPVIGYGEMILENPDDPNQIREWVEAILSAGGRSRELVQQLLAFGRRQTLFYRHLDLNRLLRGLERLIRGASRETIAIQMNLAPVLPAVRGDSGQLEQVMMNLALNALDAMPDGGTLTLETRSLRLEKGDLPGAADLVSGRYVEAALVDTGSGMDLATQKRLFEPFFTTKELGKGTGLGLAAVYGIVRQHGGHIRVFSQPGHGSTFKVYLPVGGKAAEESGPDVPSSEA